MIVAFLSRSEQASSAQAKSLVNAIATSLQEELSEPKAGGASQARLLEGIVGQLVDREFLTDYQASQLIRNRGGKLLLGNYVILDHIGSGGMGSVFRARHLVMKRIVALKTLNAKEMGSKSAVRRFHREMEAAAKLEHPNIVAAYDADEFQGVHFLVMKFIDGHDLARHLSRHGPLPAAEAVGYILQAARGLDYAHEQGVIHRDVKPSNLLLDKQGSIKILDLGLASIHAAAKSNTAAGSRNTAAGGASDVSNLTKRENILGTLDYMSPEQAEDTSSADQRSDIYALGCTLYFLLTENPPYAANTLVAKLLAHREAEIPSLREAASDTPQELDDIFRRMVAKQPADRFQTMADVSAALESLQFEVDAQPQTIGGAATEGAPTRPREAVRDERTRLLAPAAEVSRLRACQAVGIDLGTTYSSLAYIDPQGTPHVATDSSGQTLTPSVLFFGDEQILTGELALQFARHDAQRTVQFVKARMGDAWEYEVDGHRHSAESLSAIILRHLLGEAEPQIGPISTAVITVPAYFTEKRRQATEQAGRIAGLKVLGVLNEPLAATLAQGLHSSEDQRNVVVYDLGGGTFDVTVVRVGAGEIRELATHGNRTLGGRDWDQRLLDWAADDFQRTHNADLRHDPQAVQDLRIDCEQAKRRLSQSETAQITMFAQGKRHVATITRAQFEDATADLIQTTKLTVRMALDDASLTWADIDRVLLVGGATYMPAVREMLAAEAGFPADCGVNPIEAVAKGAAIYAQMLELESAAVISPLAENRPDPPPTAVGEVDESAPDSSPPEDHLPASGAYTLAPAEESERRQKTAAEHPPRLRFVTAHGVGVKVLSGGQWKNSVLIPSNSLTPVEARKRFVTASKTQTGVRITFEVTQGDTDDADSAEVLGVGRLDDFGGLEPAGRSIDVIMRFDEQGRLTVSAQYENQEAECVLAIEISNGLQEQDIARHNEHLHTAGLFDKRE